MDNNITIVIVKEMLIIAQQLSENIIISHHIIDKLLITSTIIKCYISLTRC